MLNQESSKMANSELPLNQPNPPPFVGSSSPIYPQPPPRHRFCKGLLLAKQLTISNPKKTAYLPRQKRRWKPRVQGVIILGIKYPVCRRELRVTTTSPRLLPFSSFPLSFLYPHPTLAPPPPKTLLPHA